MHWAAFNGHVDMVDLLIRKGADLQARNTYGGTVLGGTLWAVANGDATIDRTAVVRRLLAAGAQLDDPATRTGNVDIDALLKRSQLPPCVTSGQLGYRSAMTTEPRDVEPDPATEPHTEAQATAPGADAWANRIETDIDNEHEAEDQREALSDEAGGPPSE